MVIAEGVFWKESTTFAYYIRHLKYAKRQIFIVNHTPNKEISDFTGSHSAKRIYEFQTLHE